jgi:hypothetical protein
MARILFVGQKPERVDFSDPSLPPGFDAEKISAGIALGSRSLALFETVVNIIHILAGLQTKANSIETRWRDRPRRSHRSNGLHHPIGMGLSTGLGRGNS